MIKISLFECAAFPAPFTFRAGTVPSEVTPFFLLLRHLEDHLGRENTLVCCYTPASLEIYNIEIVLISIILRRKEGTPCPGIGKKTKKTRRNGRTPISPLRQRPYDNYTAPLGVTKPSHKALV